jgi:hypothetical protein
MGVNWMTEKGKIYLVTKADDLGSNHSANRAFWDAFQKGVLRNGVIMMTCDGAKEAAELFRDQRDFCMGLHLTMNAEWDHIKWEPVLPAEKVPSLVTEEGYFFRTTKELHDNRPKMDEMMAEIQAQLDLARQYGLNIRFADCHMGFSRVIDGLDREIQNWCDRNGLIYKHGPIPRLPMVESEGTPITRLLNRLKATDPGVYYIHMGHPAYDTPEMRALGHFGYPGDAVAEEREWDRRAMMDPEVVNYFHRNQIIPVTMEEALGRINR